MRNGYHHTCIDIIKISGSISMECQKITKAFWNDFKHSYD